MNYQFPIIKNIADVLPAIAGRDEFVVADKGEYTILNYNVQMSDTFLDPSESGISTEESTARAMRMECRGIAFCNKTGDIIRRAFHKFKNVNEAPETQLNNLDFSNEHFVDTKLDGSMVCPIMLDVNNIIWATKMAAPDFHDLVDDFVMKAKVNYGDFVFDCITRGYSPIFEFMHKQKRIVIDYPENNLVLLAVRNMITGEYDEVWKDVAQQYGIPVVEQHSKVTDPKAFMEYVHDLKNAEGFVIRWADGHRVKIKAHEYIQIHKAKEAILQDRNIVELILDEHLDDIKAHLPEVDRDRLTQFESDINKAINISVSDIRIELDSLLRMGIDRKTFAIYRAQEIDGYIRPIVFRLFGREDVSKEEIRDLVCNTLRNNLGRTAKYEAIREAWFPHVVYNQ